MRFSGLLLAIALSAAPVHAQPPPPPPPLNIAADNVSGSRGPEGDVVHLNGNVRITRGSTVITADFGRYLRGQGMLFLDDRVRMVDSTTTLRCDHASFSEARDELEVHGNVVITDADATIRAPSGTYNRSTSRAELFGGVTAEDSTQRIVCDQMTYLRDSMVVQARGNVRATDKRSRLELRAARVDFDRRIREARANGDPELESTDEQGRRTRIRAIELRFNTRTRVAEAVDSVKVIRDSLEARADYALFDDLAQRGWLLGKPRAWDREMVVTGDTLEIWTERRALKRFVVRGDAVMDYVGARANTIGEKSRLLGRRADVFFTDDEIDSLIAVGQASNDYQGVPKAGKTAETNHTEGDTITVFFENRKIERAVVRGHATGIYHFGVTVGDTTAAKTEIVKYEARRIEFLVPKERIVLESSAKLDYRDLELLARRVEFDSRKQTLVASGDPVLSERGSKVSGHLMTYDMESHAGTIYQALTTYERGLYHGEQIRKVGDNVLEVKHGSYSTCDQPEPHYHFSSQRMKIFLSDKLVAKPVVFYIRNVPLLALPFYIFPIKPGRHSGFIFPQVEFGFRSQGGQFVRNAGYYWAPNDYMDLTLSGDYYQADPAFLLKGEANYKLLYRFDGYALGTYTQNEFTKRQDYSLTAWHTQQLTPRTNLIARSELISSRTYNTSNNYGRTLYERLNRFLTSSLSYSHNADWASFSVVADRREDIDADQSLVDPDGEGPLQGPAPGTVASLATLSGSAPNLAMNFPTRSIGNLGLLRESPLAPVLRSMYVSLNAQFLSQYSRVGVVESYRYFLKPDSTLDSTTIVGRINSTRRGAASAFALSDSRRLFGWLNFVPAVQGRVVVFDKDNLGNEFVPAAVWSANLGTSGTFYGTRRMNWGPLVGLRHVVVPRMSFSYSPQFNGLTFVDSLGVRRERFTSFGGIGISGFRNAGMSFGFDQRFQVKLRRGENVERLDNPLSWSISGFYNFLHKEQNQKHGLSPLTSSVTLQPPGVVNGQFSWVTNVYEDKPIRSFSYNSSLHLSGGGPRGPSTPTSPADLPVDQVSSRDVVEVGEPWSLSLAYSYSGGRSARSWVSTQVANGVFNYNLSRNWRLSYTASYDVGENLLLTQQFGLVRDLHCWQATFTRTFTVGGEAEYYFRLQVKEQKDLYLERGTRFGSLGGI